MSSPYRTRLQLTPKTKVKTQTRQRLVMGGSVLAVALLFGVGVFMFGNFGASHEAFAAVSGDYRSVASGNWSSIAVWQKYNGASWVAATVAPTSTDGTISIQAGNTVTVASGATADQLVVDAGGTLVINASYQLTIANGTGTDLTVNGTLTISGLLVQNSSATATVSGVIQASSGATHTLNTSATTTVNSNGRYTNGGATITTTTGHWIINSGGIYQHNTNGGSLPIATWNSASTCEILGVTTTAPGNLNQSFGNFKWNCTSQSSTINLAGSLTTITGNFTMTSTGSSQLELSSNGSTLTVSGNYSQTGGILVGSTGNNITAVMSITGNFNMTGGTLEQLGNSGANAAFTINVTGNFSHTGGTLTESGNPQTKVDIVFNKTGTQTFTASANTVTGNINYTVNSGSILDLGTSIVLGDDFTVNSGGELIIASANGITSSGTTGNIQVTGIRTLSTSGNYTFNGTSAQVTGNGLPATVNDLTLNNSAGLTLSATVAVAGTLTLTSGKITTGNYEVNLTNTSTSGISGYSTSNYIYGKVRRSVSASGAYIFPVGSTAVYQPITITLVSQVGITNLLGFFTASSPGTPSGITINGVAVNNMLNAGYWTVTPNATMSAGTYTAAAVLNGYTNTGLNSNTNFYLLKRHDASSAWQGLGTQIPVSGQTIGGALQAASSLLTSWSDFGAGYGGGSTLPITLSSFTVNLINNEYADLNWVTSAELNNAYFEVERSADGENYETIGKLDGQGTSLVMTEYNFRDEAPLEGTSYYRLKQTDFDGPFTFSPIESINNIKLTLTEDDISLFPNPASVEINVAVQMKKDYTSEITILDLGGRKVYSQPADFYEGQNQFKLPLSDLPAGVYFVSFSDGTEKPVMKKFIKN